MIIEKRLLESFPPMMATMVNPRQSLFFSVLNFNRSTESVSHIRHRIIYDYKVQGKGLATGSIRGSSLA